MKPCQYHNRTTFSGYGLCQQIENYLITTNTLKNLIKSNQDKFDEYQEIFHRFLLCTTRVLVSPIKYFQSNKTLRQKPSIEILSSIDYNLLSSLNSHRYLQFPNEKFLQYDCGKLKILDKILLDSKQSKHRCLIYTHMIKMLDLLELYLNSRGYTFIRLDNTMKKSTQQILIERFNHNNKIFLLILSTRIDNSDINITGANTMIFYDQDWNPEINLQLQEQSSRYAQIKNVYIYHLISENTIEEKILTKNLLGDITINMNSLDKNNIQQLFNQASIIENTNDQEPLIIKQFEEALISVEDEIDQDVNHELNEEEEEEEEVDNQQVLSISLSIKN